MEQKIEWKHEKNLVDYKIAEEIMSKRVENIISNRKTELIWFLEHDSVFTLGTSAKTSDFKSDVNIPMYQTKRGGQTTYHGPGQRIVYMMLDLRNGKKDIKQLVWNIEEWLILVLKDLGILGYRIPGMVGVWVKDPSNVNVDGTYDKKIAALGLRIKKWVTFHGLALNVNPNLNFFTNINPCGIPGKGVTSLHELGVKIKMNDVDKVFKQTFSKIFSK
jgi:lipoyl(octanoyl) transferase